MDDKQNESVIEGTVKAFFDPRKNQYRVHTIHLQESLDPYEAKQLENKLKDIDTVERVHLDREDNRVQINATGDISPVLNTIKKFGLTVTVFN